jgi:hypothetical protein
MNENCMGKTRMRIIVFIFKTHGYARQFTHMIIDFAIIHFKFYCMHNLYAMKFTCFKYKIQ